MSGSRSLFPSYETEQNTNCVINDFHSSSYSVFQILSLRALLLILSCKTFGWLLELCYCDLLVSAYLIAQPQHFLYFSHSFCSTVRKKDWQVQAVLWNHQLEARSVILIQTFAVFWMLYAFYWVIPRHLNFICRRFGTLCLFHLHRQVGVYRMTRLGTCLGYCTGKGLARKWPEPLGRRVTG